MKNVFLPAKSIMTTNVITIKPNESVWSCVQMLVSNRISGMPVLDENKAIVGIITEKNLLQVLLTPGTENDPVSKYMSKKVITFKETESIVDICDFLNNAGLRRVPIVNKKGQLVGIVSRRDLIHQITKIRQLSPNPSTS